MKTEIIYFSATGTTKAIVEAISQGLTGDVHFRDITLSKNRKDTIIINNDLTIIAAPVYGERIPKFLYDFFKHIKGNGKPLVALAVYGNIGFGISLEQFKDLAEINNSKLIAAGAFIGQHTYSSDTSLIAQGRPDQNDLVQAHLFGKSIQRKINTSNLTTIDLPKSKIPKFITKFPELGTRILIKQPQIKKSICTACGACASVCPMNAIDITTLKIDDKKCLRCYACVTICPQSARIAEFRLPFFKTVFHFMGTKRKENQTFI